MMSFFGRFCDKIREINGKYANPRIKMTRTVRAVLLLLRLYLLLLVLIMGYKFLTVSKLVGYHGG